MSSSTFTRLAAHPAPLALAACAVLAGLLAAAQWLFFGSTAGVARPQIEPAVLATLEGVWRDPNLMLRLRQTEGALWARTGEGRWERLVALDGRRLRATTLGYEIDVAPALRPAADGLPRIRVSIGGVTRELVQVLLPIVNGVPITPYLRGTMNDWGAVLPLLPSGPAHYAAVVRISAGRHELKIGSADWNTIDLGGDGDPTPLTPGTALPLHPVGSNITLLVPSPAEYRFVLDLRDPRRPALTTHRLP